MNIENIPIADLVASLKMYLGHIKSSKSKKELNNQSDPSTAINIAITDLVASLKMYFGSISWSEPKTEQYNQSGPLASTIRPVSQLSPTLNAIKKSTGTSWNKKFFDLVESIDLFIELCNYEQTKSLCSLLDIKVACDAFSNEFTCLITDKERVATLKSRISGYWQLCIKEMIIPNTLDEALNALRGCIQRISSEDKYIVIKLKKIIASTKQITVKKNELESVRKEIYTSLDAMLGQLKPLENGNSQIKF